MANIAHASLTGAELHEPKGADAAAIGEVYVADGAGSGSWASVGTSAFTGMIADFPAPVAPSGWLECDGSLISTSTYSSLFAVLSITTSGTRTNGSAIISSIADTSTFEVGYYVFGTGISTGSTILSIDSATQITISTNASSSGTSAFYVSPWVMNTGTIALPDLTTAGRYRRSRTSSTVIGATQADQNQAHTHTVSGTASTESQDHTHTFSGTTSAMSANASHTHTSNAASTTYTESGVIQAGGLVGNYGSATINSANVDHTHTFSGTTSIDVLTHTHTFSATSSSSGSTEARPLSIVMLTCIKT